MATRIVISLVLGALTCFAVSAALATWSYVDRPGFSKITIGLDGDHKEPYLILCEAPGARRTIWFAKKYAYSSYAPQAGAAASQASLQCWSFASRVKSLPTTAKAPVEAPEELLALVGDSPRENWGAAVDERGWPFRSFKCVYRGTLDKHEPEAIVADGGRRIENAPDPQMAGVAGMARGATAMPQASLANARAIPFRPVWWALTANAAFYGALWFGALSLLAMLVERWRSRRGGCPKCGYDLAGQTQPGCPECGWGRAGGTTESNQVNTGGVVMVKTGVGAGASAS